MILKIFILTLSTIFLSCSNSHGKSVAEYSDDDSTDDTSISDYESTETDSTENAENEYESDEITDATDDTDCLKTWCKDKDGDSFGTSLESIESCEQPDGYVEDCSDCDDTRSDVNPDGIEIAEDGIDQDCSGEDLISCTDIGCDGYPDIVFAMTDNDGDTDINSYIYLGSAEGYSELNRIEIPTIGAMGVDTADVNRDGFLDIAFAAVKRKVNGQEERSTTSLLYYGTEYGFDLENRVEFPSVGAADITLADLDKDGWIDVLIPNRYNGEGMTGDGYKINSYVYWGSLDGFDINNKLELPTVGAAKARVADLNNDGFNDIVYPNGVQEYVGIFKSYIYWGTGTGKNAWSTDNRTTLPSVSPETATICDINDDGFDDIFISGWICLAMCTLKNRIYWGGPSGFDDDNYTKIDDVDGITEAIFKDLNNDGQKDIVLASGAVDISAMGFSEESFILWGEADSGPDKYKWSADKNTALPATAASEAGVGDLNGDGFLDVVFSSHYPQDSNPEVSQIYWGNENGTFSSADVTELPTTHAAGMKIIGYYNVE